MGLSNIFNKVTNKKKFEFYDLLLKISANFTYTGLENYEETIEEAISMIGRFIDADRVYIFQYDFEKNTCSNTFEYCKKNVSKEIENLQDVPIEGIPDWINAHEKGEILYIPDVKKLVKTSNLREILEPQGIQSLITFPLKNDGELYGFLGFDSVHSKRKYSEFEQRTLIEFSSQLVGLIKRIDTEVELKRQKQKLDRIVEAAELGVWEWDVETGEVKYDEKWADILGYSLDDLKPHTIDTWKNLTDQNDISTALDSLKKLIEGESSLYSAEFRMKHKNGQDVWIKDSGKVIESVDGTPKLLMGTHMNISELKKQQLQSEVFKKAVEYSPAAIIITNADAEIEFVNREFVEMTGYSAVEMIGRNPRVLQSGEHHFEFYEEMWNRLRSKKIWKRQILNKKKNGEKYWELALIAPIQNEKNEVTNYIAVKTDITEKKEQEMILEQQKIKLEKNIQSKIVEFEAYQNNFIIALGKLTESRDYETGKHVERVQYLSKSLASSLMDMDKHKSIIDEEYLEDIFFASALHDIGKISISDRILLKEGKLDGEESKTIKSHVRIGYRVLSELVRKNPKSKIIMGTIIARYHHERWDGMGYMDGLRGEEIPLEARIVALVDVYDALRSRRPYKEGYSHLETIEIIKAESGKHFDPYIVSVFMKNHEQFELIFDSFGE